MSREVTANLGRGSKPAQIEALPPTGLEVERVGRGYTSSERLLTRPMIVGDERGWDIALALVEAALAEDTTPKIRAKALFAQGYALSKTGQRNAALQTYDSLIQEFGQVGDLVVREQVANALFNKGVALGRYEEEIAVYDDLLARFGTAGAGEREGG